ncbi:hypothetical protein RCL1_004556 [Eukaryota sp. TZLM3-RCL]
MITPEFLNSDAGKKLINLFCRDRQGIPAEFRGTLPNREEVLAHYEEWRARTSLITLKNPNQFIASQSLAPPLRHVVIPHIKTLIPITLAECVQRVNYIHKGRVLFARIIADPWTTVASNTLLEDPCRDIIQFSLYNFVPLGEDAKEHLPKGAFVAVLEPYLKADEDKPDTMMYLRCDHPQAAFVLSSEEEWLFLQNKTSNLSSDPILLKETADKAFNRNRLQCALWYYEKALKIKKINAELKSELLGKCSCAYFNLYQYRAAFEFASKAIKIDSSNTSAALIKLKSAIKLCLFEELNSSTFDLLNETEANDLRNKFIIAKAESEGTFDIAALHEEYRVNRKLGYHHADYISRHFEPTKIKGKGRGLVSKSHLPSRTLLMATRAFVRVSDRFSEKRQFVLKLNPRTGTAEDDQAERMVQLTLSKLSALPVLNETRKEFFSLCSNLPEFSGENLQPESINLNLVENILKFNWFRTVDGMGFNFPGKPRADGVGLWLKPSLLNHSCCPNVSYFFIGDYMFVYTTRVVEANEELCISYVDPFLPYHTRRKHLQSISNFRCFCERCSAADQLANIETEIYNLRQQTINTSCIHAISNVMKTSRRRALISKLTSLKPNLRIGLLSLVHTEAQILMLKRDFKLGHQVQKNVVQQLSETGFDFSLCKSLIFFNELLQLMISSFGSWDYDMLLTVLNAMRCLLFCAGCVTLDEFKAYLSARSEGTMDEALSPYIDQIPDPRPFYKVV